MYTFLKANPANRSVQIHVVTGDAHSITNIYYNNDVSEDMKSELKSVSAIMKSDSTTYDNVYTDMCAMNIDVKELTTVSCVDIYGVATVKNQYGVITFLNADGKMLGKLMPQNKK